MLPRPQRVARALTLAFCALALVGVAAVLWVYAELPRSARHRVKHVLAEPIARALHAEAEPAPLGPSLPADARTQRDDLRALAQTAHPSARVEVLDFENPDLRVGQVEFIWQDLRRPELDALVERLGIADMARGQRAELADFAALASKVRGLAAHVENGFETSDADYAISDAQRLLDQAASGRTFTCYFYSLVLAQALVALGHPARLVGSGFDERFAHATVEVWLASKRRWVLLDADYDLYYLRGETPLNAWDLHELWFPAWLQYRRGLFEDRAEDTDARRAAFAPFTAVGEGLTLVHGTVTDPRIPRMLAASPGGKHVGIYKSFAIAQRNDWLTEHYPPGHPSATRELSFGEMGSAWLAEYDGDFSARAADLYPDVNALQVAFEPAEGGAVALRLGTRTPWFSHFEVARNDSAPERVEGDRYVWPLPPGEHRLRLWPVNVRGVRGSEVRLALRIDAASAP